MIMSHTKSKTRSRSALGQHTSVEIATQQVLLPTISATSNPFTVNSTVTMACGTSGATIRYTTDGSAPTLLNGSDYSLGLVITDTASYRVVAFKTGMLPSNEVKLTVTKSGA